MNAFDVLNERGFLAQCTDSARVRELLGSERVTFYTGFDPTADSLTAGHFMVCMAIAHLERAGHRPIILFGGGTGMVGDPSGKTDMRPMMTVETINYNISRFKAQFKRFFTFNDGSDPSARGAVDANNYDWLSTLQYIPFIREYGVHFTVSRMLAAECYKARLEKGAGLTLFEFNYMVMQAYDFLELNRRHGCTLQFAGDDQWSNIIAGVELIRRHSGKEAHGLTIKLLTKYDGEKMGKTAKGAVWLDAEKTSPFEFYQYWRNTHDADVVRFLKLLTFLPLEEIAEFEKLEGAGLNAAKEVLAFETTKVVHGESEAIKARDMARSLFAGGRENAPVVKVSSDDASSGLGVVDLMMLAGLAPSRGEAKRNISQGGVLINGEKVDDFNALARDFPVLLQKGKKTFVRFEVE